MVKNLIAMLHKIRLVLDIQQGNYLQQIRLKKTIELLEKHSIAGQYYLTFGNFDDLHKTVPYASALPNNSLAKNYLIYYRQWQTLPLFEHYQRQLPASFWQLYQIPYLGHEKLIEIYHRGIRSIDDWQQAYERQEIKHWRGFGEKTIAKIQQGITYQVQYQGASYYCQANTVAATIETSFEYCSIDFGWSLVGDLARCLPTINTVHYVVYSPGYIWQQWLEHWLPQLQNVVGDISYQVTVESITFTYQQVNCCITLANIDTSNDIWYWHERRSHIDYQQKITQQLASKPIAIKEIKTAIQQTLLEGKKDWLSTAEQLLYQKYDLPWLEPKLREQQVIAKKSSLQLSDFQGSVHAHTLYSDGTASLHEMALAAKKQGWQYLGISDHSVSARQANGLSVQQLQQQIAAIQAWNATYQEQYNFTLLAGSEVDIKRDGSLDYDAQILSQLDFTVASVHQFFNLDAKAMTERVIRAIEQPHVNILGHPTGRLLLRRAGYPIDLYAVIDAAAATNTAIEWNCQPKRLDLDWQYWQYAIAKKVYCILTTDAHHPNDLSYIAQQQALINKAQIPRDYILNYYSVAEIKQFFQVKSKSR